MNKSPGDAPEQRAGPPTALAPWARPPARSLPAWVRAHIRAAVSTLGELYRAPAHTAVVVSLMAIALALPVGLYLSVAKLGDLTERWDHSAQLTAFGTSELTDREARSLGRRLERSIPDVVRVTLKTRDDALRELAALTGLRGIETSFGGTNPLPPILVIDTASRLSEPSARPALEALAAELRARPEIAYVQFNAQWLSRLQALLAFFGRTVSMVGALLGLGLVLVVASTVAATVEHRHEEIAITRLLGATDRFVRRPFLYRGALYGLLSGTGAWLIIEASVIWVEPAVERLAALYPGEISGLTGPPAADAGPLAGLAVAGTLVGLAGAWLAVWRRLGRSAIWDGNSMK